ncbi:ATP-grasp domain-containing protein [Xanthobacter sp. TB0139]|uniref:ATP-grasp domain-containing protein n=1 Tax=Xanthobacter sp. TB0139 TaxID=3459178 RepID=UPI004039FF48
MDLAIVSLSARPLVASAARAGLSALALDLYGRPDLCRKAGKAVQVPSRPQAGANGLPGFDGPALLDALATHAPAGMPVILGEGLDAEPELLAHIAARNPILGNTPTTVQVLKDPMALEALCGHLRIPFPAICTEAPVPEFFTRPVLEKRIGGSGGLLVRLRAADDHGAPAPGFYLQREVEGRPYALLLLANGREVVELGVARLWQAGEETAHSFRHNAMTGPVELPAALQPAISAGARNIALACGLVGLVRVDVMANDSGWHVLNVTPHPDASLDLLDTESQPALLGLHLAACGGRLPARHPTLSQVRALARLRAPRRMTMPEAFLHPHFPANAVHDLAPAGAMLEEGALIASLHVNAPRPAEAEASLNDLLRPLQHALSRQV